MPEEPTRKRVVAFFDGQNLYHSAREAFGIRFPDFDPICLANRLCSQHPDWETPIVRFYTGVPQPSDNQRWHSFWSNKLAQLKRNGAYVYSRPLKYSNQSIILADGSQSTTLIGREKGIDVRVAIDMVRMARLGELDVALIFSQDQDLSEVADEIRQISQTDNRWIKIACAYPISPTRTHTRGINNTDWISFDRTLYNQCIDSRDYR